MRRPPRPTSFVTGLVSQSRWRALMDNYRAHGPTLGVSVPCHEPQQPQEVKTDGDG